MREGSGGAEQGRVEWGSAITRGIVNLFLSKRARRAGKNKKGKTRLLRTSAQSNVLDESNNDKNYTLYKTRVYPTGNPIECHTPPDGYELCPTIDNLQRPPTLSMHKTKLH